MAARRHASSMLTILVCAALLVAFHGYLGTLGNVFVVASLRSSSKRQSGLPRRAEFESGKVNLGAEIHTDEAPPPQPVIDCDESCITAIYDCLEDGCSVDALIKLDSKLAEDEQKIAASIDELAAAQKTAYSEENVGTLAWLSNFLSRSGSLRAQLQALRGIENSDFVQQIIKAAAVAFGGSRPNDYPKIGVSPYSD